MSALRPDTTSIDEEIAIDDSKLTLINSFNDVVTSIDHKKEYSIKRLSYIKSQCNIIK